MRPTLARSRDMDVRSGTGRERAGRKGVPGPGTEKNAPGGTGDGRGAGPSGGSCTSSSRAPPDPAGAQPGDRARARQTWTRSTRRPDARSRVASPGRDAFLTCGARRRGARVSATSARRRAHRGCRPRSRDPWFSAFDSLAFRERASRLRRADFRRNLRVDLASCQTYPR